MSASVTWTIDPVKEADKLTKGLKNKVLRIAMNKASATVKAAVVSNAPSRFGYLKKSIRIKVKNYKGGSVWIAVVGPKSDFKKNKGKYKTGEKKGTPIVHRPSNYARLLEKGTSKMKARPFLKPALQATQSTYMKVLQASIKQQVEALLPKK